MATVQLSGVGTITSTLSGSAEKSQVFSTTQGLTRAKVDVFRRLYIKRRKDDSTGNYEDTWHEITEDVKKWGRVESEIDEKKYSFFTQKGMGFTLKNDTGKYDHESNTNSFWNSYLTRYKTLIKVQAGFVDANGNEAPQPDSLDGNSTATLFIGVTTEPFKLDGNNECHINAKALSSVFEEIPANLLVVASAGSTGQLTASDYITRMRDVTDGSANLIAQKFITSGAFSITASTNTLTALNTTTMLDDEDCWSFAKKLAEFSNQGIWVTKHGHFVFGPKTPTSSVEFTFSGFPYFNTEFGHTIKKVKSVEEDIDLLFNRVRVKFGEADTSTSWITKEEGISVGDSTTSWKYGVRTLSFENEWLNTTGADNIASTLFVNLNALKQKVELNCRFIPSLRILNRTDIDLDLSDVTESKWDFFNWDEADWGGSVGPTFLFSGKEYSIVRLSHNIDRFESDVTLREI